MRLVTRGNPVTGTAAVRRMRTANLLIDRCFRGILTLRWQRTRVSGVWTGMPFARVALYRRLDLNQSAQRRLAGWPHHGL